jgi:hypothetical protein
VSEDCFSNQALPGIAVPEETEVACSQGRRMVISPNGCNRSVIRA